MKSKRVVLGLSFAALGAITLSSCGDNASSSISTAESTSKKETIANITVGTTAQIEKATRDEYNFDMLASGVSEMPLVAKSSNGEFSPLVASYETTDSKTWKYTIVDGLKWSDGVEVTADDIYYSLNYEGNVFTTSEKKGTYKSYSISDDKKSITLELETANIKALDNMAVFRIRPKHVYDGKETITDEMARVTCGPYKLTSFSTASNTIVFERNEYYPVSPNVDKVTYKLFGNSDIMYQSLIANDLDYVWNYSTGVESQYQTVLGNKSNIKLQSATATNCPAMLVFNNKEGLFSDQNLRVAASYALDYNSFKTYFGSTYAETPNRSFAPSALIGFKETEKLSTNLVKAREYMANAGYTKGTKYYEKNGATCEFTLTINSAKALHVSYGEFVKTQLETFGIKVNLETLSSQAYNEKTSHKFANEGEHKYGKITMEAAIMGYTAYGMNNLGGMYINGNHSVQGGAEVYDEALNQAMADMDSATTLAEYKEAAGRLQDRYAALTPAIALYWDSLVFAQSSKLSTLSVDATFGINNINNWFSITKN